LVEMGVSWTLSPVWPWSTFLPISTSQVARIIGVNHWSQPHYVSFDASSPLTLF
jgi:hypothetical protein